MLSIAVAVDQPGLGALVQAGAGQLRHLHLHQLLGEQRETVAQELRVGRPARTCSEGRVSVILGLAIVVVLLVVGEISTWNHSVATFVKVVPDLHHYLRHDSTLS